MGPNGWLIICGSTFISQVHFLLEFKIKHQILRINLLFYHSYSRKVLCNLSVSVAIYHHVSYSKDT